MRRIRSTAIVILPALLAALPACSADVTGMRIRFDHGDTDVRQYVVRITDASGTVIHECTAPAAPATAPMRPGESWTVLFDDEREGELEIEALGINPDGQQALRGRVVYFMAEASVARPVVILTGNLSDIMLPPPCTPAPEENLPPYTPRGSLVTVDERGTYVPGTDSGL